MTQPRDLPALEPVQVYRWSCAVCGCQSWVGKQGGNLQPGKCEPHCPADQLHIYLYDVDLPSARYVGTAASLEGRTRDSAA